VKNSLFLLALSLSLSLSFSPSLSLSLSLFFSLSPNIGQLLAKARFSGGNIKGKKLTFSSCFLGETTYQVRITVRMKG
jgi:predicted membrane metal-binding protein